MNLKLKEFAKVPTSSLLKWMNQTKESLIRFTILDIDYVNFYSLLKLTYGKPNGILSIVKKRNDSDNLFHWNYTVANDNLLLDIIYSYKYVEIRIYVLKGKPTIDLKNNILLMIKEELIINEIEIKKERMKLEYWEIFQNTYLRLKDTVDGFYKFYIDNYDIKTVSPPEDFTEQNVISYLEDCKFNMGKINSIKSYGLALRMLIPVMGESFINFVIFVLAKDEVKLNNRVFEATTRANIDVRLSSLNLHINGLKKPLDCSNKNIRNFYKIMDYRNKFLHGNVVPKVNTFDHVYFDGNTPIFNSPRDMNKEFSTQALFQISKDEIVADYENINNFIKYVTESISEDYREALTLALKVHEIGWNKNEKRIGILFPSNIVDAEFVI